MSCNPVHCGHYLPHGICAPFNCRYHDVSLCFAPDPRRRLTRLRTGKLILSTVGPLRYPVSLRFLTGHHGRRITSILVCHFVLALRQFDGMNGTMTESERMPPTGVEFAGHRSENLPAFLASFAQPVHVDMLSDTSSEADSDAATDEGLELQELPSAAASDMERVFAQSDSCRTSFRLDRLSTHIDGGFRDAFS